MGLLPPAPQAGASANSATWALSIYFFLIIFNLLLIVNYQFSRFGNYRAVFRLTLQLLPAFLVVPEQDLKALAKCVAGSFAQLGDHLGFG